MSHCTGGVGNGREVNGGWFVMQCLSLSHSFMRIENVCVCVVSVCVFVCVCVLGYIRTNLFQLEDA